MDDGAKIVLCIGTYIYQLRRFCSRNKRDSMPVKTKKATNGKRVIDQDILLTLLAVGHLDYQPPDMGGSFKTQTSECINCKREIASIKDKDLQLNNAVQDFNNDIRSEKPDSLNIINQFVDCCKLTKAKQHLTEILLYMIKCDDTIADDASFYINGNGHPVSKAQLETMNEFLFEPFLLGVWHFVFCERNENNKDGVQTIEAWESERNSGSKAGSMSHETIENRLGRSIQVKSISEKKDEMVVPTIGADRKAADDDVYTVNDVNDLNLIYPVLPEAAELDASSKTAIVQVRQEHKMFVYEEPLDKEAESLIKKLKEDININNFLKACILGTADISKPSNYKDYYHYFQIALGMINLRIYNIKSNIKDIDSLFYDDIKKLEGKLNLFVNKRIKPDCRDGHPNYSSNAVADIETCKKELKDIYEALYGNLTTIKDFNLMLFLKLW